MNVNETNFDSSKMDEQQVGVDSANGQVAQENSPTVHRTSGKTKKSKGTAKKTTKGQSLKSLEAKRLKRNADSRAWKKAHRLKVKTWNQAWAIEQRGDKKKADAMREKVRGPKGNDKPVHKVKKPRVPKVSDQPVTTSTPVAA